MLRALRAAHLARTLPVIGLLASRSHYLDHLQPIWDCLPDNLKGRYQPPQSLRGNPAEQDDLILVASADDLQAVETKAVLVEHGAGQSYVGIDSASYGGGIDRDRVALFIVPNQQVADRNLARYPDAPNAVVGCPKLDKHHVRLGDARRIMPGNPLIGLTWHWPCKVCPETDTALPWYRPVLGSFAREFNVLGHAHPKWQGGLHHIYDLHQIPDTDDPDRILSECDVLVCDNSSLGAEFMSLDKPVVWLNSPEYRRDVDHGGRFWSWPGLQVDEPHQLSPAVRRTLIEGHNASWIGARHMATDRVYAHTDGTATARAVEAILDLYECTHA